MTVILHHPEASLRIEDLGRSRLLAVEPTKPIFIPFQTWETSYPLDRIVKIFKTRGARVLDEIMRDESPSYMQYEVHWEMLRCGETGC